MPRLTAFGNCANGIDDRNEGAKPPFSINRNFASGTMPDELLTP